MEAAAHMAAVYFWALFGNIQGRFWRADTWFAVELQDVLVTMNENCADIFHP